MMFLERLCDTSGHLGDSLANAVTGPKLDRVDYLFMNLYRPVMVVCTLCESDPWLD
jgi:hypothetical protein